MKDGAKRNRVEVRLNDSEMNKLRDIEISTGLSKTEIVSKALAMYHNLTKYNQ